MNTKNNIEVSSNEFTWKGNRGLGDLTQVFPKRNAPPKTFSIVSAKTGWKRVFIIDEQSPGYEDGWDGECWCYTTNDWPFDTIKVTVMNY